MTNEKWEQFSHEAWERFAKGWLRELKIEDAGDKPDTEFGDSVVLMNFTAAAKEQWTFICICVSLAEEGQLGDIAAGPVEHLLGFHGDDYISAIEESASQDAKFAKMIKNVWKHKMTDEVWTRVQAIQSRDS